MSESNKLNTEEIVKQNSVSCPGISSKYWDDFPEDFVLYIETSYDIQKNQLIAHNLEEIQKIYAAHNLNFLYLPLLLQDGANVFGRIYPGAELNRTICPENITPVITASLFADLHVSKDMQGAMLLARSSQWNRRNKDFELTPLGGGVPIRELFQAHARMHAFYDLTKYCKTLSEGEPGEETDPEMRFDTEISKVVSEIDERIRFLKGKGLFRLLSDTIAPMLKSEPSRLRVTEDFRLFLPDYNNMEISLNPLPKVVYFLFLRHPEGIFIKNLSLYRHELTQIYRLLSHRDNLEDMNESIRKLTDPSDNSIYEKCSQIKRVFLQKMSDDLAQHYYVDGYPRQPKRILLSTGMISFPDALKNIKTVISREDYAVMNLAEIFKNMGIGEK